jgi:hypothetical protein
MKHLRILAGCKARVHIAQHGLQPADIRAIPAAAGGPKGLLLNRLDQFMFGEWLPTRPANADVPPIHVVGASIGAWRAFCAVSPQPARALADLARLYLEEQRYERKATRSDIDAVCQRILAQLVGDYGAGVLAQERYALHVIAVRGVGALAHPQRGHALGFAKSVAANTLGRKHLGRSMERAVFRHGPPLHFLPAQAGVFAAFDGLPTHNLALTASNLAPVLGATGAIPLLISTFIGRGLAWAASLCTHILRPTSCQAGWISS